MTSPLSVYVASSLSRRLEVASLCAALRDAGHHITYDWTSHGSVQGECVERMAEVAQSEITGVTEADVLIALLPGGRGTHGEIGAALATGIRVLLVVESEADLLQDGLTCVFYYHPLVTILVAPMFHADVVRALALVPLEWTGTVHDGYCMAFQRDLPGCLYVVRCWVWPSDTDECDAGVYISPPRSMSRSSQRIYPGSQWAIRRMLPGTAGNIH